jgi:hypothetical protein
MSAAAAEAGHAVAVRVAEDVFGDRSYAHRLDRQLAVGAATAGATEAEERALLALDHALRGVLLDDLAAVTRALPRSQRRRAAAGLAPPPPPTGAGPRSGGGPVLRAHRIVWAARRLLEACYLAVEGRPDAFDPLAILAPGTRLVREAEECGLIDHVALDTF